MYGKASYQSSRSYLEWLYLANPSSRGLEDCIGAFAEGQLVGCVHRMRLPCVAGDETLSLASLQNHVVEPSLRAGAGVLLLQRATKGEQFSLSPGVHGRLGEAYRRLGYDELPSYWLVRVLRPLAAVTQRGVRTMTRDRWPTPHLRLTGRALHRIGRGSLSLTADPNEIQLVRLAEGLVSQSRERSEAYVPWDPALVRWRFFSPLGPKHVFVERRGAGAWALLSYGVKSRINVVRLLDHDSRGDSSFVNDVMRAVRRVGAAVALAYTTRRERKNELLAGGWRLRGDSPASFVKGGSRLSVGGAATDLGFEALLTEVTA